MSRPRFLADHDLNEHILDGVARRELTIEFVRVRDGSESVRTLGNDRVFVFIGGELPNRFLAECGIQIETKFGTP